MVRKSLTFWRQTLIRVTAEIITYFLQKFYFFSKRIIYFAQFRLDWNLKMLLCHYYIKIFKRYEKMEIFF